MVFMGSGRCGRCKYWAPKFKAWVAENMKAQTQMSKMKFKFMDCNSSMRTCWNAGVRQYPGVGIYDASGKQTKFYQNSPGMKKLWADFDKPKNSNAGNSTNSQTSATKPVAVAPPKQAQHAFGKAVRLPIRGIEEVTSQNFGAFVKGSTESVIYFGSVDAQNAATYGNYFANMASREKASGHGKASAMKFGVTDCDDFHSFCYDQGAWTLPLMVAYKDGKPEYSWTIMEFNKFMAEIQSKGTAPRPPKNGNRQNGVANLFKSAGADSTVMKLLTGDNWTKEITSMAGKSLHVFYGSARCGRTRYWVPKMWANTKALAPNSDKRVFGYVDCSDDMGLCWSAGVRSYPMVAVFEKGKEAEKFSANQGMAEYMKNYPPQAAAPAVAKKTAGIKTPSGNGVQKSRNSDKLQNEMGKLHGVVKLTKASFNGWMNGKKKAFVFYGRPTEKWTAFLAKYFGEAVKKHGSDYAGAFADCDIESGLCADQNATNLPTVTYYVDGKVNGSFMGKGGVWMWVNNIWKKKTGKNAPRNYTPQI